MLILLSGTVCSGEVYMITLSLALGGIVDAGCIPLPNWSDACYTGVCIGRGDGRAVLSLTLPLPNGLIKMRRQQRGGGQRQK
jgi:hypothetical protein